jgi:transposase InsO family protein
MPVFRQSPDHSLLAQKWVPSRSSSWASLDESHGAASHLQMPNISKKRLEHRIYPYLLRKLPITRPNHVWCSDITYIPVRRGFLYLMAIMYWAMRKLRAWRLSNTLGDSFCLEVLKEAIVKYGKPEIIIPIKDRSS